MIYNEDINYIKNSSFAMEMLNDMRLDQPMSERSSYFDVVFESLTTQAANSKMVANLFKEIQSFSNIDFGKIPDSKGDLTKYKYYNIMHTCIERVNSIAKSTNTEPEVILTLNKLHNLLLDLRDDFVFGYKMNIEFICVVYQTMVMIMYELINDVIVSLSYQVKLNENVTIGEAKVTKPASAYHKVAKEFITSYEKGQWTKVMKTFRKDSSKLLGITLAGGAIGGAIASVAIALGAMVALLMSIRLAMILLYSARMKMVDYIKIQVELVNNSISVEDDPASIVKQKQLVDKLEYLAGMIEGKRIKADKVAEKTIKESNKENYSKTELNRYDDLGFEL